MASTAVIECVDDNLRLPRDFFGVFYIPALIRNATFVHYNVFLFYGERLQFGTDRALV